MLKSTFQHLKGFGEKTEKSLWSKGITDWDAYLETVNPLLRLIQGEGIPEAIRLSQEAYSRKDMDFFAEALPSSEYYRIALEVPEDVIFIDIETTGLSVYYDIITVVGWSVGRNYGVYINGQDQSLFRNAIENAKAIVTFNGTLFDLKFIDKHFESLDVPKTHIDLRFLCKRIGLSGGQKSIEKEIGFKRKGKIKDMQGEAAPILWHKYRRGDTKAMEKLIEYNHADIEGMKFILDECVKRIIKQNKIPKKIQRSYNFSEQVSSISWDNSESSKYGVSIQAYSGSTKPLITYNELNEILPLGNLCVIGIDLVSSEDRESGFCTLRGNSAFTRRVKSDKEMIQLALDAGAHLVSIDSPLSIPKGRTTFFDDDPYRAEFGITRECERILKHRGINSYPCLIQSMQKLTRRGMLLADKFRELGIPVIESYPGAAQDIMGIPRKQAGIAYLADGLGEFGIQGEFLRTPVSHDELDAITSAIVGHFFWSGMFEGLGNSEEEYLIIPDLNADYSSWLSKRIIGVSGLPQAGKFIAPIPIPTFQAHNGESTDLQQDRLRIKSIVEDIGPRRHALVVNIRRNEDHAAFKEAFGPGFIHIACNTEDSRENDSFAILADLIIPREKLSSLLHDEIGRILNIKRMSCQ